MHVSEAESARLIDGLAQAVPFRFVDRVCYLGAARVVTELHERGMPLRFEDVGGGDTYMVLEYAAQSSGLILRNRKKPGSRSLIASFRGVQRKTLGPLRWPLRLESRLVGESWTLFEFDFEVYGGAELALVGSIGIVIGI